MNLLKRVHEVFSTGLFEKTKSKNKLLKHLGSEMRIPTKGMYVKPGMLYEEQFEEFVRQQGDARPVYWKIVLNPKSGLIQKEAVVSLSCPAPGDNIEKQETLWLVVETMIDENQNVKFKFLGPEEWGWTPWLSIEKFNRLFSVVEKSK